MKKIFLKNCTTTSNLFQDELCMYIIENITKRLLIFKKTNKNIVGLIKDIIIIIIIIMIDY